MIHETQSNLTVASPLGGLMPKCYRGGGTQTETAVMIGSAG